MNLMTLGFKPRGNLYIRGWAARTALPRGAYALAAAAWVARHRGPPLAGSRQLLGGLFISKVAKS